MSRFCIAITWMFIISIATSACNPGDDSASREAELEATIEALQNSSTAIGQAEDSQNSGTGSSNDSSQGNADTSPGTELRSGETWYDSGWALTVKDFEYSSLDRVRFELRNLTDREVLFPAIEGERFRVQIEGDDTRNTFVRAGTEAQTIPPGGRLEWAWSTRYRTELGSNVFDAKIPSNATWIKLFVEFPNDLFAGATWHTDIPRP